MPSLFARTTIDAKPEFTNTSWRHFLSTAMSVTLPFAASSYGAFLERTNFVVRHIGVPLRQLPSRLHGLRIVQISDIHLSETFPARALRRTVEMANDLHGDLVVITGDFITYRDDPLSQCVSELSKLNAPLGVWGCNGNHEEFCRLEETAQELFKRSGMTLLRQQASVLTWQGAPINLIGVDYRTARPGVRNPGPILQGADLLVRHDMLNILLSHDPNNFPDAARMGIELTLAGHTHGGQVQLTIGGQSLTPAHLVSEYVAGLYQLPAGRTKASDSPSQFSDVAFLYVNRGLGTIGPPIRIGVPPEITVLTLCSEQSRRLAEGC